MHGSRTYFGSRQFLQILAETILDVTQCDAERCVELMQDRRPSGSEGLFIKGEGPSPDFDRGAGEISAARRRSQARGSESAAYCF